MRVRHLVTARKVISSDTSWQTDDLPPRHSGVYPKTMPIGPYWTWRSALATCGKEEYILLCQVNQTKDNWKAWLILKGTNPVGSLVSRYEYHGNHPGIHVHADCDRGGTEIGPSSIKTALRIPNAKSRPTRGAPTRLDLFWKNALAHFRMDYKKGDLL